MSNATMSTITMFIVCFCVVTAFSCPPCHRVRCRRRRCPNSVKDKCGCCDVCLKQKQNLRCGGILQVFGICDLSKHLVCVRIGKSHVGRCSNLFDARTSLFIARIMNT